MTLVLGNPQLRRSPLLPLQWGQTRSYAPDWVENEERPLVTLDRLERIPTSKTLALSTNLQFSSQSIFRWVIYVGVGGGNAVFIADVGRLTQVAIPAETLRVSMRAEATGLMPFTGPTQTIEASAFFADYPTATDPPTYSIPVTVGAASFRDFVPPAGATGLYIGGSASSEAFTADVTYQLVTSYARQVATWAGNDMNFSNRFNRIPVPGSVSFLRVNNADLVASADFMLIWTLDL